MFTIAYRRYVLGALTLVNTLNYLDGVAIILLLQPIKEDLHLSDTKLGLLTGIAFALFYATLGVPIARWADRGNRVTIASMAIGLWGTTVMLCLFVRNFPQLLLARVAAGIGESGCMPPTYSLLADYFAAAGERARAMAIYLLASPLAALIGFALGGWLNDRFGWRLTFFILGLPALLVALVIKFTIVEPRVRSARPPTGTPLPWPAVLRCIWQQPSTRHLAIAIVLLWTMLSGLGPWYAAFMTRSHGMTTSEIGIWLGLIFGLSGMAGTYLGGYTAARWFARDECGQMRLTAIMVAVLVPCFFVFLLVRGRHEALFSLAPLVVVNSFFAGPAFALMQRLVREEMRATTMAVVMLFANLIGTGVGPQIVGILSDALAPRFGIESLRYAMLIVSFVAWWSAYHFWRVGRTVREDLLRLSASGCHA
jgi:predicted MFS family arabinose efflux permease